MNVASITLTILNWISSMPISPRIHTQLMAIGRKESIASWKLRKENHRKKNTMKPHAHPI